MNEEIECLEVKDVRTGQTSWEPAADYRSNPAAGTYVVRSDRRKRSPELLLVAPTKEGIENEAETVFPDVRRDLLFRM